MLTFICWFIRLAITSRPNLFKKTDEIQKNGFLQLKLKAMKEERAQLLSRLRRKQFL